MKNKVITLIVLLLTLYGFRVHFVNSSVEKPILIQYEKDIEIPIESDYFYSTEEKMDGYSVTVLNTELLTVTEFREEYNAFDPQIFVHSDYFLLITIKFRNTGNMLGTSAGINLNHYILQESSFITYVDRDAYSFTSDFEYFSFSLKPGTEKIFVVPFGINTEYIDISQIEKGTPKLVISLYPHKKSIGLK